MYQKSQFLFFVFIIIYLLFKDISIEKNFEESHRIFKLLNI